MPHTVRYAIIANPVSGNLSIRSKRSLLSGPAKILDAKIFGLDTKSTTEFCACAQAVSRQCDVLVIAGGDGTFSDVINTIDLAQTAVAYLPLGTGNALRHTLNYKGSLSDISFRIRDGAIQPHDLIHCDKKRYGFMVSIGFEAAIIRHRQRTVTASFHPIYEYLASALFTYIRGYHRCHARVSCDHIHFNVSSVLSLMIMKQPYYGYGLNMVPTARFDDGKIHMLWHNSGIIRTVITTASAISIGNHFGSAPQACQSANVQLSHPQYVQIDGNLGWQATAFDFEILPGVFNIKY